MEENPNTVPNQNPAPEQPPVTPLPAGGTKPKFPPVVIIGIILFLLLAGSVAGFYIFREQSLQTEIKQTPQIVQKPTPTPNITANWKEYKDGSQEFTFKYPHYYTTDFQDSIGDLFNSNIRLIVGNLTLPSECTKNCTEESTKKVKLGNNEVFITKSTQTAYQTYSQEVINYSIKNPYLNESIVFQLYANAPYERISPTIGSYYKITPTMRNEMEKIITSLRFLGWEKIQDVSILVEKKPDTTLWKSYESNEFSIMYPSSWKIESSHSPTEGPQDLEHEPAPASVVFKTSDSTNRIQLMVCANCGGRSHYPFSVVSNKIMWAGYKSHLGYDYLGEGNAIATLRNNEKQTGAIMSISFRGTDSAKYDNFKLYKDDFITSANTLKVK